MQYTVSKKFGLTTSENKAANADVHRQSPLGFSCSKNVSNLVILKNLIGGRPCSSNVLIF